MVLIAAYSIDKLISWGPHIVCSMMCLLVGIIVLNQHKQGLLRRYPYSINGELVGAGWSYNQSSSLGFVAASVEIPCYVKQFGIWGWPSSQKFRHPHEWWNPITPLGFYLVQSHWINFWPGAFGWALAQDSELLGEVEGVAKEAVEGSMDPWIHGSMTWGPDLVFFFSYTLW